jgi:hypothetical protein
MIRKPAPGDERRPAILVSDAGPLSLLATVPGALDWLFVPGCEVWIPDIILDEVLRNPGEGRDQRIEHRAEVAGWVQGNRYRIKRLETRIGKRYDAEMRSYDNAMDLWRRAGSPAGLEPLRPDWKDRGDQSVWVGVNIANDALATGESVIALADDHNVRAAIEARGRQKRTASIDLMGTQTFIQWMAGDFAVEEALTAWDAIEIAREGKVPTFNSDSDNPDGGADDPVYIRVP